MLDILLLKFFEFFEQLLLPTCEVVNVYRIIFVAALLDSPDDVQETLPAVEVVKVDRHRDNVRFTIDLNFKVFLTLLCLNLLEDHRSEDVLVVGFRFATWHLEAFH